MITTGEKLACVLRELAARRQLYPHLIQVGRLSTDKARSEIDCMAAIATDYLNQYRTER
jgi:hypothetical protein